MKFIRNFLIIIIWESLGFSQVPPNEMLPSVATYPMTSGPMPGTGSGYMLPGAMKDCPTCGMYYQGAMGNYGGINKKTNSVVNSTGEFIKDILNMFPESNIKNGLKEYLEILGHEKYYSDETVKGSNTGISSYLSSRFSDPMNSCVRDAALSFYEDIAKVLKKRFSQNCNTTNGLFHTTINGLFPTTPDYGCIQERAKLLDVAGKESYKKLQPGWLWKLALKHANGDPNSAMFLIGICGHDDTAQGSFSYLDKSSKALEEIQNQKNSAIENKKQIDLQIKELSANYDENHEKIYNLAINANALNQQIKTYSTQSSLTKFMSCPPQKSGFYAPQSLDSKADISQEVKNEIQNIQGKIGGAENIPAKYYHVYGSAFMACQLIQNGMAPSMANLVQQQAARIYRGIRMCQSVDEIQKQHQIQTKILEPLFKKYNIKNETELAIHTIKAFKQKKITCKYFENIELPQECTFLGGIGYSPHQFESNQFDVSESEIREKMEARKNNLDAAELYRKWYFGGITVMGKKMPCSDIRVLGPSDLLKPTEGFFKLQNNSYKPEGWTDSQYKMATQKLATWDVDFKWTISQHAAGAEFAGKVCKKRGSDEKPLKGICPEGPPDGKIPQGPWGGGMGQSSIPSQETNGTR